MKLNKNVIIVSFLLICALGSVNAHAAGSKKTKPLNEEVSLLQIMTELFK